MYSDSESAEYPNPAFAPELLLMRPGIRASIRDLESQAVSLLQELVRTPSITGDEAVVQGLIANHLRGMGLDLDVWNPTRPDLERHPAFSDDGLPLGSRPVVVGRWAGSTKGARSLILNGHADVVPVGEETAWEGGPWSGDVRDGRLYGRGSCDMKGGLVAGMIAIMGLQKMGIEPGGDVWIQSVIGEETGGVGTLSTVLRGYRADAAIVLEPTRLEICPVGAGAASFRLHVRGRAAHGAMRREGVSAIEKYFVLQQAIAALEWARHAGFRHPSFREGELVAPISVGRLQAGDWPSTVPESLVAEGRFGVLPGEDIAEARRDFETAILRASQSDPWLEENPPRVEWFEGQFESAMTPHDSSLQAVLSRAHEETAGSAPNVRGVPYGSDLRFFTNNANMHAVLYGPGDVAMAHSVNESISIDELMRAAETVARFIIKWQEDS